MLWVFLHTAAFMSCPLVRARVSLLWESRDLSVWHFRKGCTVKAPFLVTLLARAPEGKWPEAIMATLADMAFMRVGFLTTRPCPVTCHISQLRSKPSLALPSSL